MKTDLAIFLYAPHPVFNPVSVKRFATFDQADSVILYSTLLENLIESITTINLSSVNYLILDNEDENLFKISDSDNLNLHFVSENREVETEGFLTAKSKKYQNNILILTDSIGIGQNTISHCLNILNMDDDVLIIGNSYNGYISFIAFNKIDSTTLNHLHKSEFRYMKFLAHLDTCPAFLNIMEKYQRIITVEDFKRLYQELSKKESLNYCSQEMHERFTHLFIEHKELLH
jgi:hypothetical protein